MKFLFALIAVVALGSSGLATPLKAERGLAEDWDELVALLPLDEILNVVIKYLEDDEFQQVLNYIFGGEFAELVLEVETIPEYNAVIDFLEEAGLPAKSWIAGLHELLGIPRKTSRANLGGLRAMVDEIKALIDFDAIKTWYNGKLQTSPEFANLFDKLGSPEFRGFVDALYANKRIQEISAQLKAAGLDIEALLQALRDFFYPKIY